MLTLAPQMDGDGNFDGFSAMGFSVLHTFEEVSVDAATWSMRAPGQFELFQTGIGEFRRW